MSKTQTVKIPVADIPEECRKDYTEFINAVYKATKSKFAKDSDITILNIDIVGASKDEQIEVKFKDVAFLNEGDNGNVSISLYFDFVGEVSSLPTERFVDDITIILKIPSFYDLLMFRGKVIDENIPASTAIMEIIEKNVVSWNVISGENECPMLCTRENLEKLPAPIVMYIIDAYSKAVEKAYSDDDRFSKEIFIKEKKFKFLDV